MEIEDSTLVCKCEGPQLALLSPRCLVGALGLDRLMQDRLGESRPRSKLQSGHPNQLLVDELMNTCC